MMKADPTISEESYLSIEPETQRHIFSVEGMDNLEMGIQNLGVTRFLSVFLCQPYCILVGSFCGKLFIIDTHAVHKVDANRQTSVLIVAEKNHYKELCTWIWKRMYESGVNENAYQYLATTNIKTKYVICKLQPVIFRSRLPLQ